MISCDICREPWVCTVKMDGLRGASCLYVDLCESHAKRLAAEIKHFIEAPYDF